MATSSPSISQRFVSLLASRGTRASVLATQILSPRVRLVRLGGPALKRLDWKPGDKIKLHVPPGALRSYTPSGGDRRAGTLDVVFHLHGDGPAARWAASAQTGDPVAFLGPKASVRTTVGASVSRALFLGDETTLGLMRALVDGLPEGASAFGAIETEPEDEGAVGALQLPLLNAPRRGQHGAVIDDWIQHADLEGVDGAWLSGEADAVSRWIRGLTARGLDPQLIRAKAYWSTRGHDHRKRVEREAGMRG